MPKLTQKILEDFATLSGDYNPIHLDFAFARQSYFGEQIIYGIYQVFYVLEEFFTSIESTRTKQEIMPQDSHANLKNSHINPIHEQTQSPQMIHLYAIKASFDKPIGVQNAFSLRLLQNNSASSSTGGGARAIPCLWCYAQRRDSE